jgi:hypothetical protein
MSNARGCLNLSWLSRQGANLPRPATWERLLDTVGLLTLHPIPANHNLMINYQSSYLTNQIADLPETELAAIG